ncbi:MAG: tol-pal system-associated acyl-CoA thioesterase [Thalassovita sp.]
MSHTFPVRVYYEDTDMAGIVYYANYLRYIERARSDWVKGLGIDQNQMKEDGFVFAVRRVEADYLLPAKLDDDLTVVTDVVQVTAARLVMDQQVKRDGETLFQAIVTVVMINEDGQPARLPANIRRMLH